MIDTRRTRRVPGRGFRGDSRAAGGFNRVVCGSGALGALGATGGIRGHSLSLGLQRIRDRLREVFGSLGTRGGSEGSRRKVFTRHSETDGNSGDIRGKSSRCGAFGDAWQLGKNPGGEMFRSALGTRGGFRGRFEEGFRRG